MNFKVLEFTKRFKLIQDLTNVYSSIVKDNGVGLTLKTILLPTNIRFYLQGKLFPCSHN